jgi:hypothetical protein
VELRCDAFRVVFRIFLLLSIVRVGFLKGVFEKSPTPLFEFNNMKLFLSRLIPVRPGHIQVSIKINKILNC